MLGMIPCLSAAVSRDSNCCETCGNSVSGVSVGMIIQIIFVMHFTVRKCLCYLGNIGKKTMTTIVNTKYHLYYCVTFIWLFVLFYRRVLCKSTCVLC